MSFKDTVTTSTEKLTGRVKWFNNKAGYGFITVTDGSRAGSDIFVHHTGINVENQQYKYLVQGEYVEFVLENNESGNHEFNASYVNGVNGGKLMCETRREFKLARSAYKSKSDTSSVLEPISPREPRQPSARSPRTRGEGPREPESDKKEWTTVTRTKSTESQSTKPVRRGRGRPPRTTGNTVETK